MKKRLFFIHTFINRILLKIYKIPYGKAFTTIGLPVIYRDHKSKIKFGNHVTIVSNMFGNLLGINHRAIIVAREGGEISIGNHVGISGGTIYSLKKIKIDDYVNCGANVKIIDHDFHPLEPASRKNDDRSKIRRGKIWIKSNVFIGTDSIILRGTTIGENCIIGAKSVVKGKFPANCVIAGNPAKVIRELSKEELAE